MLNYFSKWKFFWKIEGGTAMTDFERRTAEYIYGESGEREE
jgi:hypothetical protein